MIVEVIHFSREGMTYNELFSFNWQEILIHFLHVNISFDYLKYNCLHSHFAVFLMG